MPTLIFSYYTSISFVTALTVALTWNVATTWLGYIRHAATIIVMLIFTRATKFVSSVKNLSIDGLEKLNFINFEIFEI